MTGKNEEKGRREGNKQRTKGRKGKQENSKKEKINEGKLLISFSFIVWVFCFILFLISIPSLSPLSLEIKDVALILHERKLRHRER